MDINICRSSKYLYRNVSGKSFAYTEYFHYIYIIYKDRDMNKVIKQKWTDKDKFYREDLFTRAFDRLADRYAKARKQKA